MEEVKLGNVKVSVHLEKYNQGFGEYNVLALRLQTDSTRIIQHQAFWYITKEQVLELANALSQLAQEIKPMGA